MSVIHKIRRKMRKQVKGRLNLWGMDQEAGERVFDFKGIVFDLRESNGRNKRAEGELTPVIARPQKRGAVAVCIDGVWFWEYESKRMGGKDECTYVQGPANNAFVYG